MQFTQSCFLFSRGGKRSSEKLGRARLCLSHTNERCYETLWQGLATPFEASPVVSLPFIYALVFSTGGWCCRQALWMLRFSQMVHHPQTHSFLALCQDIFIPCFLDILFHNMELMDDVVLTYFHGFQIAQFSGLTLRTDGPYMFLNDLKY